MSALNNASERYGLTIVDVKKSLLRDSARTAAKRSAVKPNRRITLPEGCTRSVDCWFKVVFHAFQEFRVSGEQRKCLIRRRRLRRCDREPRGCEATIPRCPAQLVGSHSRPLVVGKPGAKNKRSNGLS